MIVPCTFEEILPIWKSHLWPERQSPIESTSAIDFNGQIDMSLMSSVVFFWKALRDHEIIGVVGAQVTGSSLRSRGLWVDPRYRGKGIGLSLIAQVRAKALELQADFVWTMPRASSLSFYEKAGFQMEKEILGYEYGPHYIAKLAPKT